MSLQTGLHSAGHEQNRGNDMIFLLFFELKLAVINTMVFVNTN